MWENIDGKNKRSLNFFFFELVFVQYLYFYLNMVDDAKKPVLIINVDFPI